MKLSVHDIPEEGRTYSFSKQDLWFKDLIKDALEGNDFEEGPASALLKVFKTGREVFLKGNFSVPYQASCDRCLEEFLGKLEESFSMTLLPSLEKGVGAEDELSAEDLESGYYVNDEVDVGEILREQLILDIPSKWLCSEGCRGLCPRCGANLNQESCSCSKPVDPRWAAIEKLKK